MNWFEAWIRHARNQTVRAEKLPVMRKTYYLFAVLPFVVTLTSQAPIYAATKPMLTGVHWAKPTEYQTLKNAGIDFVVTTVAPDNPASWIATLRATQSARMKVVIGAYPAPYVMNSDNRWTITPNGIRFLAYLRAHSSSVMAIFVFNEPYWKNPFTHETSLCGEMTAAQLRSLRITIQSVWRDVKIYDDIGAPAAWVPRGSVWRACLGNKYADQRGVADYVGIWKYPFTSGGFAESSSLVNLRVQANFVTNSMGATPILLGQSFAMAGSRLVFPTRAQIRKWNCDLRSLPSGGVSWYVWRQNIYTDHLSNHPEYLPDVVTSAC